MGAPQAKPGLVNIYAKNIITGCGRTDILLFMFDLGKRKGLWKFRSSPCKVFAGGAIFGREVAALAIVPTQIIFGTCLGRRVKSVLRRCSIPEQGPLAFVPHNPSIRCLRTEVCRERIPFWLLLAKNVFIWSGTTALFDILPAEHDFAELPQQSQELFGTSAIAN